MFNITHTSKPGVCKARRCKHPAIEQELCEKHFSEWTEAGRPPFGAEGTAITVSSVLPRDLIETLPAEKANAERAYELVRSLEITDQQSMDTAGVFLSTIRQFQAALDVKREAVLRPAQAIVEGIKATFEPIRQIYAATEGDIRSKIRAHVQTQAAAAEAARVQVEAAGGVADEGTLALAHGIENVALPVGMSITETWDFEVTDEKALRLSALLTELWSAVEWPEGAFESLCDMVGVTRLADPRLLVPNRDALKQMARELQAEAQIPGVRVFKIVKERAARRAR